MADEESSCSESGSVDKRTDSDETDNVNPLYLATSTSEHSTLNRHLRLRGVQQPQAETTSAEPVRVHRQTATPTDDPVRSAPAADVGVKTGTVASSGSLSTISSILSKPVATADDNQSSSTNSTATTGPQLPTAVVKPAPTPCPPTRLVRTQSAGKPDANIPRINCPEKIVICLDISKEMEKRSFVLRQGDKKTPLELIRRALNIFVQTKFALNSRHEFALMFLDNTAHWMCDFTSSPLHITTVLDGVNNCVDVDKCDLSSVFHEIASHVQLPNMHHSADNPPYVIRVILIYGRSMCQPVLTSTKISQALLASDYFCLDVFYMHDPPTADNQCEAIFDKLCSLDVKGNSYILEASRNATRIFDSTAQLLAHPLQRPLQQNVNYVIPGNGSPLNS
jgi:hypothetical protein